MRAKYSTVFLIIFFSLVYLIPSYWLFIDNNAPIHSIEEKRTLNKFPEIKYRDFRSALFDMVNGGSNKDWKEFFGQFYSRAYQRKVENGVKDRFPFRLQAIRTEKRADRQMINLAYLVLDDEAIPADATSDIYITRDKRTLFSRPERFNRQSKVIIDERVSNYINLISQNSGINFYAFYIQRIQDSQYHPLNRFFSDADNGKGLAYFQEYLPHGLNLITMKMSSYADQEKYSFRTDLHWNIHGVCQALDLLYPVLKTRYVDIPAKPDCQNNIKVINGVRFLGYYARTTLYPVIPDIFEVSTADLPDYKSYIDGKEQPVNNIKEYLAGEIAQDKYFGHYGAIFGPMNKPIEYVVEENPDRNLLMIGGSFRKPIEPFLAALYRHTYVIDIRYEKNFSLGEFLKQNHVDDILIIGENNVIFSNSDWLITP